MKDLAEIVKPYYSKKDSMHNFNHILRIKKRVDLFKKDYNVNEQKLKFLVYFHGLKDLPTEELIQLGFPQNWIVSLRRHTTDPKTIEEKLVHDANLMEAVGEEGIKKAMQVAKERNQTMQQTLKIMRDNVNNAKFYTKIGKELGEPGIKIIKDYLKGL